MFRRDELGAGEVFGGPARQGQEREDMHMADIQKQIEELEKGQEQLAHVFHTLFKSIDDLMWYQKVSDIAQVRKVTITGPPPANPTVMGPVARDNPLKIEAYTFFPVNCEEYDSCPLLVFPHGGIHSNFSTRYAQVVRELIAQGYVIVAPEYRGSTGYGEQLYKLIDYGGLEVEDTYESRNWILETYPEILDPDRVGILGWSHGGFITLHNIFEHPEAYSVAYASVPVSDLIMRQGYKTDSYREMFSVEYHLGRTPYDDLEEYRKRSPAWNAEKLQTPLRIETTTNDEDVHVLEVMHLIKSLKAAGKEFEYEIHEDAPGGHAFNRIDTALARQSRRKVYEFLAAYLNPPVSPEMVDVGKI